jgi:hypothetical protein
VLEEDAKPAFVSWIVSEIAGLRIKLHVFTRKKKFIGVR